MNALITNLLTLLGRIMIATIFILSTLGNKIPNFTKVAGYMASEGVPAPALMLVGAIAFLLLGSISIIFGYRARFGAALLLTFLILATYYFHDFWTLQGQAQQEQMIQFMKNLSLMGTMVFIIAVGPGGFSFDGRRRRANQTLPNDGIVRKI